MPVHEGQEFDDFADFKRAILAWANYPDSEFSHRVKKSDSALCAHAGCSSRVSAVRNEGQDCVVAVNLIEEHTCAGAGPVARNHGMRRETTSGWAGRHFRLGQNKEVFDAEVYAIYQALCILGQRQEDGHRYTIFVHSTAIGTDTTGPGQRFTGGVEEESNSPATISL